VVETNSNGLYKYFQFEYCRRLPLPGFVLSFSLLRNGSERNSELFSLPLKGSEGNSESLLLLLFRGTEFRVVFSSAEGFGREFREIASISVPRNRTSDIFSLPRKGSERNSENFCFAEQPEFRRK
jgi:hypothetical protein